MKYVRDDEIKAAFITMLNKLIYGYRLILTPYLKVLENSSGDEAIHRIQHLEQLIAQNSEQREALTKLMAQGYIDQILYNQETNELLLQAETSVSYTHLTFVISATTILRPRTQSISPRISLTPWYEMPRMQNSLM